MPPSKSTVKETILNSNPGQWKFFDAPESWVHWDEQISVSEVVSPGSGMRQEIDQPDFASLPDAENDIRSEVRLEYQGIAFQQLPILKLDGFRITMIEPDIDPNTGDRYLTQYENQLSQIMSQDDFQAKRGNVIDVDLQGRGI